MQRPTVLGGALPISEDRFQHAEGPIWDGENSRLLVVNMLAGDLVSFDFSGKTLASAVVHIDDVLAFIRPRREGGWVAASADSILILNDMFEVVRKHRVFRDPETRFNEGGCDADGNLFAGTMAYDATPGAGTLYGFGPELQLHVVLSDVSVSNGIVARPGAGDVYYVDSATRRIDILTVNTVPPRRAPFVALEPEAGAPDGLTVDADGGVWVALWGSGRVRRYDQAGMLTHEVVLPTPHVSSCAFGGIDRSTLFITTSQVNLPDSDLVAGAVFSLPTEFQGAVEYASII